MHAWGCILYMLYILQLLTNEINLWWRKCNMKCVWLFVSFEIFWNYLNSVTHFLFTLVIASCGPLYALFKKWTHGNLLKVSSYWILSNPSLAGLIIFGRMAGYHLNFGIVFYLELCWNSQLFDQILAMYVMADAIRKRRGVAKSRLIVRTQRIETVETEPDSHWRVPAHPNVTGWCHRSELYWMSYWTRQRFGCPNSGSNWFQW